MKTLNFSIISAAMLLCNIAFGQHQCFIDTTPVAPAAYQQELSAGPCKSNNGYLHSPKGNLHIMYIVVVFNNEPPDAQSGWWPENGVPNYAALNGAPNNLLDIDPDNLIRL